ncbi:MAG TPA: UDP-N-acetylglucosamine 2-epimerase (non-hydrolyzing) [Bryobacteraceae bacterium]|nr:UDP-N-acetylglucosamine 2-epimerase (non-hydrolyzing) [Bryobacteraceae bacterium]
MRKILFIFGTRPEAIKLCPVVLRFRAESADFTARVCVTAQHRQLLDQVLQAFGITPDHDLNLMLPGQTLFQSTSRILAGLEPVLDAEKPDMVFVQGDTTTTFCGALAAFYKGIPVGHVEAGLRTWDLRQPFPEEANRVLTSRLTALHFAPTEASAENLRNEGVAPGRISVTGNTGIDAVLYVRDGLEKGSLHAGQKLPDEPARKLLLVTAHRRESFGEGFESLCRGLLRLADRPDVQIVYPVHPNPNVQDPVNRILTAHPRMMLVEPMSYVPFVDLMRRATIIITDSGGIQEEAPSLGKPVLVLREKTERPEAVLAGTVRLVGTDEDRIFEEASRLLDDPAACDAMSRVHNPYGDGRASDRIVRLTRSFFELNSAIPAAIQG